MTIYFDKLAISFNNKIRGAIENVKNLKVSGVDDLRRAVDELHNNKYSCDINLFGYDSDDMFNDFHKFHYYIEAAGGVVENLKSEYLFIKRIGIWGLPKGKMEIGETQEETAMREVCEETGLVNVDINSSLPDTYHIYSQKGRWFLKKTYWFSMQTSDNIELIPQTKEDISEAIWMTKPETRLVLSKSYRSLFETLGYLFK